MSSTTTDDERCNTPTSSDTCDTFDYSILAHQIKLPHYRSCPWRGRAFIIRDSATHLVIGLQNGCVFLVPDFNRQWYVLDLR